MPRMPTQPSARLFRRRQDKLVHGDEIVKPPPGLAMRNRLTTCRAEVREFVI